MPKFIILSIIITNLMEVHKTGLSDTYSFLLFCGFVRPANRKLSRVHAKLFSSVALENNYYQVVNVLIFYVRVILYAVYNVKHIYAFPR